MPTSIIAPMPERRLTGGLANFSPGIGVFSLVGRTVPYFEPESGKCAGGPCNGRALFPLPVQITEGRIVVTGSND